MAPRPFFALTMILPVLMIDSVIEVGLIGEMVGFLHDRAGDSFSVSYPAGQTFELHGKPKGLLVDQGHTSNGAAGTALILVGVGGFLSMWLHRRRARQTGSSRPSWIFTFWVVMSILSMLLTLAALIYTFVLTNKYDNQTIDLALAAANPEPILYPADKWAPENWFGAILNQVPLTFDSDRRKIKQELRLMRGWRWNLIPLFVLGLLAASAAVYEWISLRRYSPSNRQGTKERTGDSF